MGSVVDGIYQPSLHETGWDDEVNANFARLADLAVNVKGRGYEAQGDGSTDDSTAFTAAEADAGAGGTIFVPPGTYRLNNWTPTTSGLTVRGAGMASSVLKAKTSAVAAATISQLSRTTWEGITFDGNSAASDGLRITGATLASSLHNFIGCQFQNSIVGCSVLNGSPTTEADQNMFLGCYFVSNTTGFKDVAVNGQDQVMMNCRFGSNTTGIELGGNATLAMFSGQITLYTTGILFSGTNGNSSWVHLHGVEFEGNSGSSTTDIDGTSAWPTRGVDIYGGILQAGKSAATGKTVIMKAGVALRAKGVGFVNGDLNANFANTSFEDEDCSFSGGATVTESSTSHRISRNLGTSNPTVTFQKGSGQNSFVINLGTGVVTCPKYSTAGRPSASTAGDGAMYYDTTLDKPGWSDGTNWKDAAGTNI